MQNRSQSREGNSSQQMVTTEDMLMLANPKRNDIEAFSFRL